MLPIAQKIQDQLSAWRRDFHMHPELGFREERTAARVASELERIGCRVRRGVGRTGVVAELGRGRPVVAIRADMDALPIEEANPVPYASRIPGVMHACGHDAHTAMALGAAALLAAESLPGTVRFLFQPAEEIGDEEGISGAPRMIADGAMEDVEMIFALHVDPETPTGQVRCDPGSASAGVDSWFSRVIGKGGHGAAPHHTVDPFYLTGHVIVALNAIVSRRLAPIDAAVVSIGSVKGGAAENVIPDEVRLTGTLRYMEKGVQEKLHAEIRRAFDLAKTLGGDYELKIEIGTPPMINHPEATALMRSVCSDLLGPENIIPEEKGLGAEDFGCLSELAPGAQMLVGVALEGPPRALHTATFDLDENALPIGAAVLAESALRFLKGHLDDTIRARSHADNS